MKKLLSAMFVVGLLTSGAFAQDEGFRFFLDLKGVAVGDARPANDPLAFTNPEVTGTGRFYLYIGYGTNNQNFSGNNLRVTINGDATFTGGAFYNKSGLAGVTRWQAVTGAVAPTPGSTDWVINSAFKVGGGGYGARNNDPGANGPDTPGAFDSTELVDNHFRQGDDGSAFGTTLLGYFDVAHGASATQASINIRSGDSGSAGVTVTSADFVYFGFGDAGTTNKKDRTSANADGFINAIPEPASLTLLALGALALRRRK